MHMRTNLRELRERHGILLTELEELSGLSNQYISRGELGQIRATMRLESQMDYAIELVILKRGRALALLESDYQLWKGGLLLPYKR